MNTQEPKFGALSSTTNPQELAVSVQSALKMIGYIVTTIASLKGLHIVIDDAELQQLTDAVVSIIAAGLLVWQGGIFVFASVRKMIAAYYAKK